MANSAQVNCAASYSGLFSFELRAGQTEQQGPGVSQGSGRCVCLQVAPEREILSFASAETGERRNCLRAEPLVVWMLAYRCEASAWMQSSPGKPGVISTAHSLLWQYLRATATVQGPLVQGTDCEQGWDERRQLLRDCLKFDAFSQVLWKKHPIHS